MSKKIEDVIEEIRRDARIVANTERLLADALVVLATKDGANHKTIAYDDYEVCCYAKDVLHFAYDLKEENDRLKAELNGKKIPWYKRLFHC